MIVELKKEVDHRTMEGVIVRLEELGCEVRKVRTQRSRYLVAIGAKEFDIRWIGHLPEVKDVHRVSDAYKLVSRKWKAVPTTIDVGDGISIKEGDFTIIAGPCSIESEEQVRDVVAHLKENGVRLMRGGVFKPRTSPYAFRGLGTEGLKMFSSIARENNIRIISEVMEIAQIREMYDYVDVYQIGARNTQNFNLLHELGIVDKPVMIKRGLSGTLEELLQSAEYVFSNGNEKLILCERGIRTFETSYRNVLDFNAIPMLKEKSHLPVIIDPSHGIGLRRFVPTMALSGIMAGADGMIYEVHKTPEKALSDAQQTLNFDESGDLVEKARAVYQLRESL